METTVMMPSLQPGKADPPSKNRVWDFSDVTYSCTGANWSQVPDTHQEIETTSTTTVSGVVEWLSKDPIGISGGLNQYVAFGNNPVMFIDPLGLWNLWSPASWGISNGVGWSIWDSLNPFHESGGWSGYGWGAKEGAAAALDGMIPFWNPFEIAYTDECGNVGTEYKVSKFLGGASGFLLFSGAGSASKGSMMIMGKSTGFEALVTGLFHGTAAGGIKGVISGYGTLGALGVEGYTMVDSFIDIFSEGK